MKMTRHVWLWPTVVLILFIGISLGSGIGLGLYMLLRSQNTTEIRVGDALDGRCHAINEPPENSPGILTYPSNRGTNILNLCTNTSAPRVTSSPNVSAVSMDATYVYWAENKGIYRAFRNGTAQEVFAFIGLETVLEIAVDWITGNIYFIGFQKGITVCTKYSSHCTSIRPVYKNTVSRTPAIQGLAVHPTTGFMYWSEENSIIKSQMNGESPVAIITDISATGLAIDYLTSRLYWINAKNWTVESMNLDGTGRKAVVGLDGLTLSIAVSGSRLFWNDISTSTIYSCDKSTGQKKEILIQREGVFHGIHIYDPALKPDLHHPCNNNSCEEICLLAANRNYTCACSPDRQLKNDGKTCEQIKNDKGHHLIVAAGGFLYDYHHGVLGKPHWKRINDYHHFADIYSSVNNSLSDNDNRIIFNEFSRFFKVNGTLGGIAFDYVGHNLYSTNPEDKRIEIMSLVTLQKTFIQLSDEPRSILLIPEAFLMIVTICRNNACSVNKMSMTGSEREPLCNVSDKRVSLAFDLALQRLFITDEGGIIESISLNNVTDRQEVYAPTNVVSLAILGNEIFWTEKDTKKIFWKTKSSKRESARGEIGVRGFNVTVPADVDVMHLIQPYYPGRKLLKNESWELHECRVDNGGCSHVCLVESGKSHVCKCPSHMILNVDQKNCRSV